jgi:shikimate dehydrogenase
MTDRYAVIGNPIGHTKSPMIHAAFARTAGHDIEYLALEAPIGGFSARVDEFIQDGGLGLNITAPFKQDAFAYATDLRERARLAGAVNAMKFEGDRRIADNFDGIGLTNDIQRNLGYNMKGRRILLLGAGGAARGAMLPFLEQHPAEIVLANRSVAKADELRAQYVGQGHVVALGYEALNLAGSFDLVINATSASWHGAALPIPLESFATGSLAYDLVYGRGLTPFLRAAKQAGAARIADGVGMLVEQAAEAFAWWRGVRPQTGPVIAKMTIPFD